MKKYALLFTILVCLLPADRVVSADSLPVIGGVETLVLVKEKLRIPARIDTGAQTSSLSAVGIQPYERDGRKWLRFQVKNQETGRLVELKRPLIRMAKIKRHGQIAAERPVVRLLVAIGPIRTKCEFTLVDRSDYKYPALVGRNFLSGRAMVDVSREFVMHPASMGESNGN